MTMIDDNEQHLVVAEEELLKLILEFLASKDYHVSLRTLERESGVINCDYSDEVLFLRELILDGDFEEVVQFGTSFKSNPAFDERKFNFIVLRQKFIELIYTKCHILGKQNLDTIGDVMKTLSKLEKNCSEKEEYNNLCWLLTLPDLNSHDDYKDWNVDISRMDCFHQLLECLSEFMPLVKRKVGRAEVSSGNRLLQLIVKGLFYETCTEYCESSADEAFGNNTRIPSVNTDLLHHDMENDFSTSLLCWIHSLPREIIQLPFELHDMDVCYSRLNEKKTHHARIYETIMPNTQEKPKSKSLTRQYSDPNKRDLLKLSCTKSKSIDHCTPNILSSSLPTSTLRNCFESKTNLNSIHTGRNLQYSYTAGSKGLSKPLESKFSDLDLKSPSVPPIMSSSIVDMSPAVNLSTKAYDDEKPSRLNDLNQSQKKLPSQQSVSSNVSKSTDSNVKNASAKNLFGKEGEFISSIRGSTDNAERDAHQEPSVAQTPAMLRTSTQETRTLQQKNDLRTSLQERTTLNEQQCVNAPVENNMNTTNLTTKKTAIAFELFDPIPPAQTQGEQKRREEVLTKLKQHEQSRQESLKAILTDNSSEIVSNQVQTTATAKRVSSTNYSPQANDMPVSSATNFNIGESYDVDVMRTMHEDTTPQLDRVAVFDLQTINFADVESNSKENTSPSSLTNKQRGPVINGVRRPPRSTPSNKVTPSINNDGRGEFIKSSSAAATQPMEKKFTENHDYNTPLEMKNGKDFVRLEGSGRLPSLNSLVPVAMLEDAQAIRSICFHPSGKLHAIGANSKTLRICTTHTDNISSDKVASMPVVFKKPKYHRGSIYCMSWDPDGRCIATGSNDKTIKLLQFDENEFNQIGDEIELSIHAGTVRDLAFVPKKNGYLISGGAGAGSICITDINTQKIVGTFEGHSGNILTVYVGDAGDLVATGGTDNTLRLWDMRSQRCIDVIVVGESSPASACLSTGNKYVASGQEDGSILLYDITAGRTLHNVRFHKSDCRSVRFSPDANYLMTSSYDATIALMDLRTTNNDFDPPPKHYAIGQHLDKVIQCRWHPTQRMLLSSSADRRAILWKATTVE